MEKELLLPTEWLAEALKENPGKRILLVDHNTGEEFNIETWEVVEDQFIIYIEK